MKSFYQYSKKISDNFLLVQGPGGNTSIKSGGHIYVKKSGYSLMESESKDIFKKIDYERILHFYKNNDSEKKYKQSLSIETPLHVLLPSKYVFHYHSLSSIIISCMYQKKDIDNFLIKNEIVPIPYIRPGAKLAKKVIEEKKNYNFKNYFLYNHGFVIEGQNVQYIYNSIKDIEVLFSKLLDYNRLSKLNKIIQGLKLEDNKIINPNPELNYEEFNNLYLFPDHHVFVPQQFKSGRLVSSNSTINFDSDFIYLNENISETQFIYLKVVLLVFNMISEKKVFNHIDVKVARSLSNSPDEKLRKKINL